MNKFMMWIIPPVCFAPDGSEGGDPKPEDKIEDENLELDLTDDTDLSQLDAESIYQIMEMDNIQESKLMDWVKSGMKEQLFFKDIKEAEISDDEKKTDDAADPQNPNKDADDKDKQIDKDNADPNKPIDGTEKPADKTAAKADADKDKTLETKTIKVSEEYIANQLAKLKEQLKGKDPDLIDKQVNNLEVILTSIKDGEMDGRSLKNYINAQTYIKTLKTPLDKDWKPDPKVVNTPEYIEKATKQKQQMIADAIREKYPDYPTDGDKAAVQDFEDSLTNREYDEYKIIKQERAGEISDRYDRYQHLTENWEDIARDTVKSEIYLFTKKLESLKIKAQDLGISNLDLDDKNYNEYLYKNVLFDEKGNPKDDIFTFVDNVIPVVKPFSIYNTLVNANMDQIIALREAAARKEAYRKGIDDQPDPSLSDNQQNPGQRDEITINENSFDDDSLTPEQHDSLLAKLKNSIIRGKRK